jgi:hypothetical protein
MSKLSARHLDHDVIVGFSPRRIFGDGFDD